MITGAHTLVTDFIQDSLAIRIITRIIEIKSDVNDGEWIRLYFVSGMKSFGRCDDGMTVIKPMMMTTQR